MGAALAGEMMMSGSRRLVALFAAMALVGSLTACDTRAPVGARDAGPDHAQIDGFDPPPPWPDFGWPWPEWGPDWPDTGLPSCTCLPWSGNSSCACHEIFWGCKENPQRFSVCDLPPPCLLETVDALTGCRKPKIDTACSESCFQPPPGCDATLIGKPCTSSGGQCGPSMTCLLTHPDKGGVCTCPCTPDDPLTPLVNEDSCPDLSSHLCGSVPLPGGGGGTVNLCLRKCSPKLGSNTCAAPLACSPRSVEVSGVRGQAVCALFACQAPADCPVLTAKPCQPSSSGGPATCIGANETCVSTSADNKTGLCAKSGICEFSSGLCAPRKQNFNATAKVADPCNSDLDCNANQRCERERALSTAAKPAGASCTIGSECCSGSCQNAKCEAGLCPVHARNGYCVVEDCAFPSLPAFGCPTGSSCNRLFPRGLCQRSCDLTDATSCRGNALDKLGDYECRAWNNISTGGYSVSDGPVCDFGDRVRCNSFNALGCDAFGLQPNPTDMSCRDLSGTKLADPRSPFGLCLDNTASGPAGP